MKEFFEKEYLEIRGERWKPLSGRDVVKLADLLWRTFAKAYRYERRVVEADEGVREWCLPWVAENTEFIWWDEWAARGYFGTMGRWQMGVKHGGNAYFSKKTDKHRLVVVVWEGSRKLLGKTLQEVVKPEYLEYVAREIGYPLPKEFKTAFAYREEPRGGGLRRIMSVLRRLETIAKKIAVDSKDFRYES